MNEEGVPQVKLTPHFSLSELPERFRSKVVDTGDCWVWVAHIQTRGYGTYYVSPQRKSALAHRVAYETLVGPVPDGLEIDHLCRVRHCVNPAHLEPVTRRENVIRGLAPSILGAVHGLVTHCPRGHAYDEQNTRRTRGRRYCRSCDAARHREKRAERRLG